MGYKPQASIGWSYSLKLECVEARVPAGFDEDLRIDLRKVVSSES